MKILLAVDGSSYTIKAADYLTSHFAMFREPPELHVLHVQQPLPMAPGRVTAVIGQDALDNYYRTEAQEALAPAEAILKKGNIPFKGGYCIGDVAQQIDAYVRKNNIDMIAMGTHGHGILRNLVMGSVAAKVLATSSVPVLLIK